MSCECAVTGRNMANKNNAFPIMVHTSLIFLMSSCHLINCSSQNVRYNTCGYFKYGIVWRNIRSPIVHNKSASRHQNKSACIYVSTIYQQVCARFHSQVTKEWSEQIKLSFSWFYVFGLQLFWYTAKLKSAYFTMDFPPALYFRPFWM